MINTWLKWPDIDTTSLDIKVRNWHILHQVSDVPRTYMGSQNLMSVTDICRRSTGCQELTSVIDLNWTKLWTSTGCPMDIRNWCQLLTWTGPNLWRPQDVSLTSEFDVRADISWTMMLTSPGHWWDVSFDLTKIGHSLTSRYEVIDAWVRNFTHS